MPAVAAGAIILVIRVPRSPLLSPPALTAHASNRVCNALALLQCVASHPETRTLFLNGKNKIPFHSLSFFCIWKITSRFVTTIWGLFLFLAHIPLYLYPFLNTVSKNRPFEYLRLTSLGVIGALVKVMTNLQIMIVLYFGGKGGLNVSCIG